MTRFLLGLLAAMGLASASAAAPLEAYGRLPNVEAMQLSPDGELVASIVTDGEARTILITRASDGRLIIGSAAGDVKVRAIQWAGRNHLLITVSSTALATGVVAPRSEWSTVLAFDIRGRKLRRLLDNTDRAMNVTVGQPEVRMVDGRPLVLMTGLYFPGATSRVALFAADLDGGGVTRLLEPGFEDTVDWVVDAQGKAMAQSEYDHRTGKWRLRLRQGSGWRIAKTLDAPIEFPSLLGLGREGQTVLIEANSDEMTVQEIALLDGAVGEAFRVGDELIHDQVTHNLIGYLSRVGDEARYTFFQARDQRAWDAVQKAYPGQIVTLVSMSDDRRKLIVLVDSPTEGRAYALVDLDAKKATWLGLERVDVLAKDVSQVRAISYKAKDGLDLAGYLTLPAGRAAKGLPLVVLPHGGPAVRDYPGFDWWAQALASRGYAVLQVNYRGSDGYGRSFLSAGFGQWGRKMQTDLSDGVRYLAGQGIIDPKRVCIVGASYGGYAALAGVTLDRGVYRCAASVAGPSDLRRMVLFSRGHSGASAQRYWLRFMGVETLSSPDLRALSPVEHAAEVEVPVLLVHGKDDTIVSFRQSQIMADALKRAGKPVELVPLKGEDHWLSRGDTRLQMLQAVVDFLERHNPPS